MKRSKGRGGIEVVQSSKRDRSDDNRSDNFLGLVSWKFCQKCALVPSCQLSEVKRG